MSRHYDMYCKEFQENRRANSCIHSLRSEVKQLQTELDEAEAEIVRLKGELKRSNERHHHY